MSLSSTLLGTPGTTSVNIGPGSKPPGYNFARDFYNQLGGLTSNPFPTYQGQLDPGLSPTLQALMQQGQGYASSGAPSILAGVNGSLGGFMNPSFVNPMARMGGSGVPDYFNQNGAQTGYNGESMNSLGAAFGAQGGIGQQTPPYYAGGQQPGQPPAGGAGGGMAQPGMSSFSPGPSSFPPGPSTGASAPNMAGGGLNPAAGGMGQPPSGGANGAGGGVNPAGNRPMPPNLLALIASGQMTPQQAQARNAAFNAGQLPGQQNPTMSTMPGVGFDVNQALGGAFGAGGHPGYGPQHGSPDPWSMKPGNDVRPNPHDPSTLNHGWHMPSVGGAQPGSPGPMGGWGATPATPWMPPGGGGQNPWGAAPGSTPFVPQPQPGGIQWSTQPGQTPYVPPPMPPPSPIAGYK